LTTNETNKALQVSCHFLILTDTFQWPEREPPQPIADVSRAQTRKTRMSSSFRALASTTTSCQRCLGKGAFLCGRSGWRRSTRLPLQHPRLRPARLHTAPAL
jgi:hypothetical protein